MRLLFTVTLLVFTNLLHADSSIKKAEDEFVKKLISAAKKVDKLYNKKIKEAKKKNDRSLSDKLKNEHNSHKVKVKYLISSVKKEPLTDDTVINFSDPVLKKLILKELNLSKKEIRVRDVKHVKKLNLSLDYQSHRNQPKIKDISSLRFFSSLEELDCEYQDIENIRVLANLKKLKKIDFCGNKISDISPIAQLRNLINVRLQENKIRDVSPLQNLSKLESLFLDRNDISDLSKLNNLTNLESVGFCHNQIIDIAVFKYWSSLEQAWMNGNKIKNLTNIADYCKRLKFLCVVNCGVEDISFVSKLVNIEVLLLGYNQISSIKPLENLKKVRTLNIPHNKVNDLSPLTQMIKKGCFSKRSHYDESIEIEHNNMELKPGTMNRKIIDLALNKGIVITWQEGNNF